MSFSSRFLCRAMETRLLEVARAGGCHTVLTWKAFSSFQLDAIALIESSSKLKPCRLQMISREVYIGVIISIVEGLSKRCPLRPSMVTYLTRSCMIPSFIAIRKPSQKHGVIEEVDCDWFDRRCTVWALCRIQSCNRKWVFLVTRSLSESWVLALGECSRWVRLQILSMQASLRQRMRPLGASGKQLGLQIRPALQDWNWAQHALTSTQKPCLDCWGAFVDCCR